MTLEDLKKQDKSLIESENSIDKIYSELGDARHLIHEERRRLYGRYIDEHFPFKVGDHLRYTFINSDGDTIVRDIEISKIDPYRCNLSSIIIEYEWQNRIILRIDYVNIDGTIHELPNENRKIEKID